MQSSSVEANRSRFDVSEWVSIGTGWTTSRGMRRANSPSRAAIIEGKRAFMKSHSDKDVIRHWVRLYNRLTGSSFQVKDWPDRDSSKKNIDAMCCDNAGRTLAIEHTLIEPFEGERADKARFMKTLAPLQHHPSLLQPGYGFTVSSLVNSIPKRGDVTKELLRQLPGVLPTLPEGRNSVVVSAGDWTLELRVDKVRISPDGPGKFFTGRVDPGDPGAELIVSAFRKKAEKLSASAGDIKILLLEKDASAGTIEGQFEQLPDEPGIRSFLARVDEIWRVNTVALESENVISANQIWPSTQDNSNWCSLNLQTEEFRRRLSQ